MLHESAPGLRWQGPVHGRLIKYSAPAISQHLKVLRQARLVRVRADAQRRIYTLDTAGLDEIDHWLKDIRRFWCGRLDALEQALENQEEDAP